MQQLYPPLLLHVTSSNDNDNDNASNNNDNNCNSVYYTNGYNDLIIKIKIIVFILIKIMIFIIIMIIIMLPLRLQWVLSKMIRTSSFIFYNDISTNNNDYDKNYDNNNYSYNDIIDMNKI